MITLYDYLPSQNAYKVRLLLKQLDIAYETRLVSIFEGEGQTPAFLEINPGGAVPVLQLDDGRTLAESNAILTYLAHDTPYLPADNFTHAKVLQWLFFEGEQVQSTVATLRHWMLTGKDRHRTADVLADKRTGALKVLNIIDRELARHRFIAGDSYTIADISVFAYVHLGADAGLPMDLHTNIERWIGDIRSQPRFDGEVHPYSIDPASTRELPG